MAGPVVVMERGVVAMASCVALMGCGWPGRPLDGDGQREARMAERVLGLHAPYALKYIGVYQDGGTVSFHVVDSRGKELRFCLDGRMRAMIPDSVAKGRAVKDSFWLPPSHFFVGADHPTMAGAREVPAKGRTEMALVAVLDVITLQEFGRARRDSLVLALELEKGYEVRQAMARLSKEEMDAMQAAAVVERRRQMDPRGQLYLLRGHGQRGGDGHQR